MNHENDADDVIVNHEVDEDDENDADEVSQMVVESWRLLPRPSKNNSGSRVVRVRW